MIMGYLYLGKVVSVKGSKPYKQNN